MVNSPTVFILGAGASMPYGFPSGDLLKKEILGSISGQNVLSAKSLAICKHANIDFEKFKEFRETFLGSNINSIDSFLSKRAEYVEIGKIAIAVLVCAKESRETFRDLSIDDNWYVALWNSLIAGVTTIDDFRKNQFKVITFNYDRSLEFFLHTSLMNTFNLSDQEAFDELKHFSILHVYGELGSFTSANYGINTSQSVLQAASAIKIIPEARDNDPTFLTAQEWLNWARRICILGFSFDELNVKRLGLNTVNKNKKPQNGGFYPMVVSSAYGLTKAEIDLAQSRLGVHPEKWYSYKGKCLETIREHIYLLN